MHMYIAFFSPRSAHKLLNMIAFRIIIAGQSAGPITLILPHIKFANSIFLHWQLKLLPRISTHWADVERELYATKLRYYQNYTTHIQRIHQLQIVLQVSTD